VLSNEIGNSAEARTHENHSIPPDTDNCPLTLTLTLTTDN
jgi:hypothetical protein